MGCMARHMFVDESNIEILDQLDQIHISFNKMEDSIGYDFENVKNPPDSLRELSEQLYELMVKFTPIVGDYFLDTYYMYRDTNSYYPQFMLRNMKKMYLEDHYDDICYYLGVLIRSCYLNYKFVCEWDITKDEFLEYIFKKGLDIPASKEKSQKELYLLKRYCKLKETFHDYSYIKLKYKMERREQEFDTFWYKILEETYGYLADGHYEFLELLCDKNSDFETKMFFADFINNIEGYYVPYNIKKFQDMYCSKEARQKYNKYLMKKAKKEAKEHLEAKHALFSKFAFFYILYMIFAIIFGLIKKTYTFLFIGIAILLLFLLYRQIIYFFYRNKSKKTFVKAD